ncbi:MAG TPA: hypothetical protein VGQ82_09535 [Chthoniobacterales bacterium]|nr:hypothetical protein [Chthoniobacterales bacterium]
MKPRRGLLPLAASLLLCGLSRAAPASLDEIRAVSNLPAFDAPQLEHGEILSARGLLGDFPRGVYAESLYLVHAPLDAVGRKLLHWNPTSHAQLQITTLREYRWPAPVNVWDALQLDPTRADDRWLIDRTSRVANTSSDELHLTASERSSGRTLPAGERAAAATEFWRKILRARDGAVATGALDAIPSYRAGNQQIAARSEFTSLLQMAPRITAHFAGLTKRAPFVAGQPVADEIVPYWEAERVRGHTNLHAGLIAAQKGAESWQLADCTYYTSDTYFFSVTLYELVPQANGTLVWQIDFASAPFRAFTGGIDRLVAGSLMIKATAETARLFRRDVEGR